MSARHALYAALMAGGLHSPDRSESASAKLDAYRAEVLREAARLLEATGRDDDAVNLLDNMAAAHEPGGTAHDAAADGAR